MPTVAATGGRVEGVQAVHVGARSSSATLDLVFSAFFFVPLGLLVSSFAYEASHNGSPWGGPLFWAALVIVFAPAATVLWSGKLSRGQAVVLLVAVGLGLYAMQALQSPGVFTGFDELLHYRTLDDILQSGRLFRPNPLLTVSPFYPGLELVTHAVVSLTGLPIVPAGLIVIAIARVLLIIALYLFLERVADSPRAAVMGTLLYMAAPSFVGFDAAFAYESLALPLAAFCLFVLRLAQGEERPRRTILNIVGGLAALAVVATHHVTSFVLAGALVLWTVATMVSRKHPRDPLPGDGWVAALSVTAIAGWLTHVATGTVGYLAPHAVGAAQEALRIIAGEGVGRRLFQSAGGVSTPLLERAVGLGSVALIVACLPFGFVYLWRRRRHETLVRLLAFAALVYPAVMALRFTQSGWEIGSRAMAFISVPVSFVLAAGLEHLAPAGGARRWSDYLLVAAVVVVFLGGVVAGTSPTNRLPRPYAPGAWDASVEGEGLAAATWAKDVLGPGGRMVGDLTNSSLMGSYGRQRVLSSTDGVSVSGIYLLPWGSYQRNLVKSEDIQYAVVDRRIAGVRPLAGFFFESWEHQVADYGSVLPGWELSRFDELAYVDRIYDSGGIQIYDLRELTR